MSSLPLVDALAIVSGKRVVQSVGLRTSAGCWQSIDRVQAGLGPVRSLVGRLCGLAAELDQRSAFEIHLP